MLPSCQSPVFLLAVHHPPLPSSTSLLLYLSRSTSKNIGTSSWKRIPDLKYHSELIQGCKRGRKLSWLPGYSVLCIQHFTALQSFYSFTECISYQLTGCTAILAVAHRATQLQSDGVSITAETLMRLLTGDTHWSLLFLCFYLLISHEKNWNQPECHNKHSLCRTNEWKDFEAT